MKEALLVLDHVRLNFSPGGLLFLNITIAFAIKPSPTVALGMILVAACPGGNISNFMSSLAKGNIALSVSLTAFATVAATVMTPANFAFWGDLYVSYYEKTGTSLLRPIVIDFWQVVQTVFILLGIPVILGLFVAQKFPNLTMKIKKPIKQASIIIFILFVIVLLSANFSNFMKYIHLIFIIVLIHNGLALGTGFLFSTIMRRPRFDRRAITIETGIQNSGLGWF